MRDWAHSLLMSAHIATDGIAPETKISSDEGRAMQTATSSSETGSAGNFMVEKGSELEKNVDLGSVP